MVVHEKYAQGLEGVSIPDTFVRSHDGSLSIRVCWDGFNINPTFNSRQVTHPL